METLRKEKQAENTAKRDHTKTDSKADKKPAPTFTSENLTIDPSTLNSSNKGQGPAGENL